MGVIIPVGTKVHVVSLKKKTITFQPLDSGITFTMTHVRKYSTITMQEFFDRYFSIENPVAEGGRLQRFTYEEQKNIRSGKIAVGMSKEAVLMAYGYPPTHTTRDLSDNTWTYWRNRFVKQYVTFDDNNRVTSIRR
jgi:hypothetical protein